MRSTMDLLNKALEKGTLAHWTRELQLGRSTLPSAKARGHLSPGVAGLMAQKLGEDPVGWIVVAALELESGGNGQGHVLAHLKEVAEAVISEPVKRGKVLPLKTTKRGR